MLRFPPWRRKKGVFPLFEWKPCVDPNELIARVVRAEMLVKEKGKERKDGKMEAGEGRRSVYS